MRVTFGYSRGRMGHIALLRPGLGICAALLTTGAATAHVTISSAATTNMSCSSGICAPTAVDAVLNVGDLETLLSTGSVVVTTTGAGVQSREIRVDAPLTWSTAALTLDAYHSVIIDKPVAVTGSGALTVITDDGGKDGSFSIGEAGDIEFQSLSAQLSINGANYALVNSIAALASAVAADPSGNYALAQNYDASTDGVYTASPVPTTLTGAFDGLGNSISHLSINASSGVGVGLFSSVEGAIRHLGLEHVEVIAAGKRPLVGGLAGQAGDLFQDHVSGTIEFGDGSGGGLAGAADSISFSHSSARVTADGVNASVGSLVGQIDGTINDSFATGNVMASSGECIGGLVGALTGSVTGSFATGKAHATSTAIGSATGGLVGCGNGNIANSYATGPAVSSVPRNAKKAYVKAGGLVGYMVGGISYSYSTGRVHAASVVEQGGYGIYKGGLVGIVQQNGSNAYTDTYWDTTSSKNDEGSSNDWSGITGLTTEELQSGLPTGFDPAVWAENPDINGGMPYLRSNPPEK